MKMFLDGFDQRAKGIRVSRKIMVKAKAMHDENATDRRLRDTFTASRGWLES